MSSDPAFSRAWLRAVPGGKSTHPADAGPSDERADRRGGPRRQADRGAALRSGRRRRQSHALPHLRAARGGPRRSRAEHVRADRRHALPPEVRARVQLGDVGGDGRNARRAERAPRAPARAADRRSRAGSRLARIRRGAARAPRGSPPRASSSIGSGTTCRRWNPAKAEALFLHDALGHDLAEVALLTGVSVAAAQSRLVRARKDLLARIERNRATRGGPRSSNRRLHELERLGENRRAARGRCGGGRATAAGRRAALVGHSQRVGRAGNARDARAGLRGARARRGGARRGRRGVGGSPPRATRRRRWRSARRGSAGSPPRAAR